MRIPSKSVWLPGAILILAAAALFAVIESVQLPGRTFFWRAVQNAGHVPLFGVISLLLLGISLRFLKLSRRYWHYFVAFSVATAAGAVSEYVQMLGPRDADIWDFARDAAGAFAFLGLTMVSDGKMSKYWRKWGTKATTAVVLAAGVLLVVAALPVVLWAAATYQRDRTVPLLCDFGSPLSVRFLRPRFAEFDIVKPPAPMTVGSKRVCRVAFRPATFSGLVIEEPYPDWSEYEALTFIVYSGLDSTVNLTVRIEDAFHNEEYDDRFTRTFRVKPGNNTVVIPLDDVRKTPSGRNLDMTSIKAVQFCLYRPPNPLVLYFDQIRLD